MPIINVNKLVQQLNGNDHYTYVRVTNMLRGLKGKSTKKEIQAVRKVVERELSQVVSTLEKLENQE